MNTATSGTLSGLPAASEQRFSLHEFLDKLLLESTVASDSAEYASNLEIEKLARAKRNEYLRTQRALAGY